MVDKDLLLGYTLSIKKQIFAETEEKNMESDVNIEKREVQKLTKKQKAALIAGTVVCVVAVAIEVFAAITFGDLFKNDNADAGESLGAALSLIVLMPAWIMFGCTTSAFSVIFNLCMMKPLGRLWKISLCYAIASFIAVSVVAIELVLLGNGGNPPDSSAFFSIARWV